ncbi:hypothetical protein [Frigidibacter sp. ROC022]|uniref:hypothetical protein n=1 Tax=Frigidibacter sp. ROC022 TaxID=2971796 RepID=UPI00215B43A4|nr:hypothetical protein [Frigidibacter sp. ROC022]MCR8722983.1 hypothetical protein [Frigidibacter sp. ROC022]
MSRLLFTIALIATAWSLASVGYFRLAPWLGAEIGYNDAPIIYAFYYAAWALVVYLVFRRAFIGWAGPAIPQGAVVATATVAVIFTGYALIVLPRLPATEWTWDQTPVEFYYASSWYFLPKSVEILFQQILIAALVLALNSLQLPLRRIMGLTALLFGGFHLTLALNGDNPLYVARYALAATIFGAVVPWLLLRKRLGFLISYAIHWSYYALDIVVIHYVFAAPPG